MKKLSVLLLSFTIINVWANAAFFENSPSVLRRYWITEIDFELKDPQVAYKNLFGNIASCSKGFTKTYWENLIQIVANDPDYGVQKALQASGLYYKKDLFHSTKRKAFVGNDPKTPNSFKMIQLYDDFVPESDTEHLQFDVESIFAPIGTGTIKFTLFFQGIGTCTAYNSHCDVEDNGSDDMALSQKVESIGNDYTLLNKGLQRITFTINEDDYQTLIDEYGEPGYEDEYIESWAYQFYEGCNEACNEAILFKNKTENRTFTILYRSNDTKKAISISLYPNLIYYYNQKACRGPFKHYYIDVPCDSGTFVNNVRIKETQTMPCSYPGEKSSAFSPNPWTQLF